MNPSHKPIRSDHFHSSAYAKAAQGASIGATDVTSFKDRTHIERNRQNVQRYANSMIGMGHMRETYRDKLGDTALGASPGVSRAPNVSVPQRRAPIIAVRPAFREPPTRGFNPYG